MSRKGRRRKDDSSAAAGSAVGLAGLGRIWRRRGDDPALSGRREPAWRRHLVLAAVIASALFVFPYFEKLNNPNENVRIWSTRAIAHHGTFSIDAVEAAWGEVSDRAEAGGRRYSSKAPGVSLAGVPVHLVHDRLARWFTGASPGPAATTWVLRVFTVVLPMGLFLLVFGRRVEAETGSPAARDLLLVALGLGTLLYPYGLTFVGHALAAALLFAGFLTLVPGETRPVSRLRLWTGGVLVGLSVVFEYQALFGAALVAIFALVSWRRRVGWFLLGALGPALLLGLYHAALFGSPFTLPYANLDDPMYQTYHHGQGFLGLGQPRADVIRRAWLYPDYGLFFFSPFLAVGLGIALVESIHRGHRQHILVAAITLAMTVFLSGMANWRGGWCAGGPRYIATVVPFLVWALALAWKPLFAPRGWARAGLVALVIVGVFLCAPAGAIFPHFPLQFDNPVFDLIVPLLADGYVPHGLGTALGLSGLPALGPWLLAVALALGACLLGARSGKVGLGAVVLAALIIFAFAQVGDRLRFDERKATDFVRGTWEPAPASRRAPTSDTAERGDDGPA